MEYCVVVFVVGCVGVVEGQCGQCVYYVEVVYVLVVDGFDVQDVYDYVSWYVEFVFGMVQCVVVLLLEVYVSVNVDWFDEVVVIGCLVVMCGCGWRQDQVCYCSGIGCFGKQCIE